MLLNALNLSHSFENLLYENVSLELKSGESIAILGVSGSGKSTLLANLSTMLKPLKGKVSILESSDIYALKDSQRLHLLRHKIGIIFQAHYLFRGFSTKENLQVGAILANQQIDIDLLANLGIAHTLEQNCADLSGGQQQRLSIARVLIKKPKIIFADEPTGNLDKKTANDVMSAIYDYLARFQAGLIIATHDEEIAKKCTKVYKLTQQGLHTI